MGLFSVLLLTGKASQPVLAGIQSIQRRKKFLRSSGRSVEEIADARSSAARRSDQRVFR